MELKGQFSTGQQGPSRTVIVDGDTVLIRQGSTLALFSTKEQKVVGRSDLGSKYDCYPSGFLGGKYIEIQPAEVVVVDSATMAKTTKRPPKFETEFESPSFVQVQQHLLILNKSYLYLFDLGSLELSPVAQLPSCDYAALFVFSQKQVGICSFVSDKIYILDVTNGQYYSRPFLIPS